MDVTVLRYEMRRPECYDVKIWDEEAWMCCYILSSIYLVDWTDPGLVLASGWRAELVVMLMLTRVSSPARRPLRTEGRGRGYVGSLAWVGSDHEPGSRITNVRTLRIQRQSATICLGNPWRHTAQYRTDWISLNCFQWDSDGLLTALCSPPAGRHCLDNFIITTSSSSNPC